MSDKSVIDAIRAEAIVLHGDTCMQHVIREIGDIPVVLLGEATHGTEEFYWMRSAITRQLITQKGFDAIAVEADWPDALRVSRYIQRPVRDKPLSSPESLLAVREALTGFTRFPQWMWRNTEIVALVDWLGQHNQNRSEAEKIRFFGLDLYSLHTSIEAVIGYLAEVDPEAARQARARYSCFDHLAQDPQRYGYAASFGMKKDCEDEVVRQLIALTSDAGRYLGRDGLAAEDELFYAQQNARVAQNAEAYYRAMFQGRDESWNLRDTHMADTVTALQTHLSQRKGRPAKIVIWAHNSHIGDARATEMGDHGQLNLGQLMRERLGPDNAFLLGFTTHKGTVTAASEWDSPSELKTVRPSHRQSFERLFHDCGLENFFLPIRGRDRLAELRQRRLERAIGVIYLPESERYSHYFEASIAEQFDAIVHLDETRALTPLEEEGQPAVDQAPETYPSGM